MDFDLSDHVSIVTGASKGLGKAMVEALVEEGASVFAVARDRDKLQELENQNPESVRIETFDFSDPNSLSRILKKAVEEFGRVNSIVNNAGIAPASDSLQTETSEFENVFKVNLLAPMVICQAAAQYFIDTETTGIDRHHDKIIELAIKVVTRAERSEFGQIRSGRLVVRVSAPPAEGKANSELLKFLASSFGCSQRNVNLRTGLRSREKRVQIKAPFQIPEFLSGSLKRD